MNRLDRERHATEDTPDCPFVIELFTSRVHRRGGLARALIRGAMAVAVSANEEILALRVDEENIPALRLYRSLGFREWESPHPPTPLSRAR